jgi:FAD/FMN-containing dehydrogenase
MTQTAARKATGLEVRSWDDSLVSYPRATATARTTEDVVSVMRDAERYPAPVRPRGSGHSPAFAWEADGGTIVDMRPMSRILEIGADTVTAEAGALYIDVAKALEREGKQLHVNTEIGCVTVGSAACCATKDASMPGELGQISSYVARVKLVTAAGEVIEIGEDEPELMQAFRGSYGMFGIVTEVTLRTRPLQRLAVEHRTYRIEEFVARLPELAAEDASLMFYFFPFLDRVTVEFRRYRGDAPPGNRPTRSAWKLRNLTWRVIAPSVCSLAERYVHPPALRYGIVNGFNAIVHVLMDRLIKGENTSPPDQIIRYPEKAGWNGFTSSIWAFPVEGFGQVLLDYCEFVRTYYRERHYRPNMLAVGYRVAQDTGSLLSYSYDGPVLTIDPVSSGTGRWHEFLDAVNGFADARDGSPLLNQTPGLTPAMVRRAFGDRLDRLEEHRRRLDPDDRLLNRYFRELLAAPE